METGRDAARGIPAGLMRHKTVAILAVAFGLVIVAVAGANFVGSRPEAGPSATRPATPAGTGIAARLPIGADATFSWSPDGVLLLVSDSTASHVYDRFGKLVSTFPAAEGWLDASRLIGADGSVANARSSRSGTSPAGARVIANGHGSAAIVTGTATCGGDSVVDWYRGGRFEQTHERSNPIGWSDDGSVLLLGHVSCSGGATGDPWQGGVQVIDFATGKVQATLIGVHGLVAFTALGESVAATTTSGMAEFDLDGTGVNTFAGVRFLGWLDAETLFVEQSGSIVLADLDPPVVDTATAYQEWQADGPTGLHLGGDLTGAALRILAANGSTLLDLSSDDLMLEPMPTSGGARGETAMQPDWWSPDGGMLAIESRDGKSLALISVDPNKPA